MVNQVINEIFRQMTKTLTLAFDVPVRPMVKKGLTAAVRKYSLPRKTSFYPYKNDERA